MSHDSYRNVIHLQASDVDQNTKKINGINGNGFVVVYAPWCGYCQQLQPTWEGLAGQSQNSFLAIDAVAESSVAQMLGVGGYPTILEISKGVIARPYGGKSRSRDDIMSRFQVISKD
jgi:hypothetical protein